MTVGEPATAAATSAVRPRPTNIQPYTARRKAPTRSAAAAMAVGDGGVATTSFTIVLRQFCVARRAERQKARWTTIASTAPAQATSSIVVIAGSREVTPHRTAPATRL